MAAWPSGAVRRCRILLFPTLWPSPGPAAGPGRTAFRRLPEPDGVPAQPCTALAQDRAGFLWIGTQGGLVRNDGYRFRVFHPEVPATLGGSYVRALHAGRDGRLRVGTFSGWLSVFDPATETFRRFRHDPEDSRGLTHEAAVIHRDLKPQTIFLVPHATEGFPVKILELGLAKSTDADFRLTGTGMLLGTPAYMAPEQVRRGLADARMDLYAFGAVACEVLARRPLVSLEQVPELLRGAWNPPPPPSNLVPALRAALDGLFAQALAADPEARPGNAAAWGGGRRWPAGWLRWKAAATGPKSYRSPQGLGPSTGRNRIPPPM